MRKSFAVVFATVACSALVLGCSSSSGKDDKSTASGANSSTASVSASSSRAAPSESGNATIPVNDLASKVTAAMKAAPGFRLVGKGTYDEGKSLAFDIHYWTHKTAGSITEQGQKIELISLGGSWLYFKLPDAVWKQLDDADAAATFSGKWVKVPVAAKEFKPLADEFDRQSFVDVFLPQSSAGLEESGPATVDGVPATKYVDSGGTQLFIALSGPPVILKAVDPFSLGGTVTFSDYDKPYSFSEPSPGQAVDIYRGRG